MTFEQRCAAAVLAAGPGAALTGLSAARLLGLWRRAAPGIVSVKCGRRGVHVAGVDVRHSSIWNAVRDAVPHCGLPVIRCERLVVDLAGELSRFQMTNVVKEAAFRGLFRVDRFLEIGELLSGVRGLTLARRAVDSYLAGCAGTRSALEDRMLQLIRVMRYPMPDEAGVPIGPHEVDLVWWSRQLIVEVDGPGHRQPNSRKRDPARDSDLRSKGFTVVRYTNRQIDGDPAYVVKSLDRLLK